ncbi:hypothetical protein MBLNU13_g04789t1 [Cladosporium sp. NU13]
MSNAKINNADDPDHILRGQANWITWFLRFRLDAHVEGIWSLFDGSEEILPKSERSTRPACAGTDLTTTSDASNTANNALAATNLEMTSATSTDCSHQIFLYETEIEVHRMDVHDYEQSSFAIQLTRRKTDQISLATCKDMSEYLNKMRQLRQELAYAGEHMSDALYIAKLLDGLPARYDNWRDRYYHTAKDSSAPDSSLVSFEGRLIHWEYKMKQSAGAPHC